jgi:hypothetical protein
MRRCKNLGLRSSLAGPSAIGVSCAPSPGNHLLIHGIGIDYMVQQYILNAGFIDTFHELKNNRLKSSETTGRVGYIYVSPNLQRHVLAARFIRDKFTALYSDHMPMCLILEKWNHPGHRIWKILF